MMKRYSNNEVAPLGDLRPYGERLWLRHDDHTIIPKQPHGKHTI
jgi:hypothetical protein